MMGDHSAVMNNHSSKKNGTSVKSKRTKLSSKSETNNLAIKYLKERNYSFIKGQNGDASTGLTHSLDEMSVAHHVQAEISRSNAFSYSNVSCLNNTPSIMDQQFAKLIEFVEDSAVGDKERQDLRKMLEPMLCHLFLEMTKSRDGKLAGTFLKKYAPIVCPGVEAYYGDEEYPEQEDQEQQKPEAATLNGHYDLAKTNAATITTNTFKSLFKTLFGVTKKQDVDFLPDVVEFRSSKFKLELSSKGLFLLKRFLSKGHILILQILQSRFQIDVRKEEDASTATQEEDEDEDEDEDLMDHGEVSFKTEPGLHRNHNHLVNGFVNEQKPTTTLPTAITKQKPVSNKYYLDSLAEVVQRFSTFNLPINLHVLENAVNVSSVSINREATLIAGGFEESHILVWPINQLPLPDQRTTRQPWSARRPGEQYVHKPATIGDGEGGENESGEHKSWPTIETCPHNELEPELEYNGEALVLRGHRSAVTSVLYSEHHPVLYSTSRDCTMRLWTKNETSYQCGSIYRGHNHPIWCVAESSNNLYVATGSKDATARLWVTDREFPVQVYAGHKMDVDAIDFHPNGNYLATASDDLTIRLWCVTSGKLVRVFTNNKQPVRDIKFSPDGQYLASVGLENKVRIYDLAAGQQLMEMKNVTGGGMESVAWGGNSRTLAASTTNGGVVRLYSLTPVPDQFRKRTYVTGCKRVVRVVANKKNTYTCIGIQS